MKLFKHAVAIAGLTAATLTAVPAIAQVEGKVATSSIANAILGVPSFQTAFNQVSQTYAGQLQQIETKRTQLDELLKPYDTNSNGTIDQGAESDALQAGANLQQIQTLRGELSGLESQITAAQIYTVEQVLVQYQAALNDVAAAQQIVMVVDPGSLLYVAPGADITQAVSADLATKVTVVGNVPPQGYKPSQTGAQVLQEIQLRLVQQARARAAQEQQQQPEGNTEAPAGR